MLNASSLGNEKARSLAATWEPSQALGRPARQSASTLVGEDSSEAALREAIASLCAAGGDYADPWQSGVAELCSTPSELSSASPTAARPPPPPPPPGYQTPVAQSAPPYWSARQQSDPSYWGQPPVYAEWPEGGQARAQHPAWDSARTSRLQRFELDELSRHLTDVLQQNASPTDASPSGRRTKLLSLDNPLALDPMSRVMGAAAQLPTSPSPQQRYALGLYSDERGSPSSGGGYSASLVVPSIDRFRSSEKRSPTSRSRATADETASSVLGSDVPTELKLDASSCLHPEGRAWFSNKKTRAVESEADVEEDDDEDEAASELPPAAPVVAPTCVEEGAPPKALWNTPVHSVPPASLACRKRLTLTGSRGTKCLRRLMTQLQLAVSEGDWEKALQHTRTFAMCSETDAEEEDDEDGGSGGECEPPVAAPNDYEVANACKWASSASQWVMLRPSDVMSYSDFVNMCASCFYRLPHKAFGLPEPVSNPKVVRSGAKDIRQLLCDVETILLMCLASKIDLEPAEKLKLKNVVASIVFLLSWHPSMLEAIAVIFLKLQNQTNNDCFCSFLSRWTFTTNAIQILFEVFCLLLIRQKRYLAFLLVVSATEHGANFVKPLLSDSQVEAQISDCLPEAGPILGAQAAVIESLRVPCYAISIFLHDLIVGDRAAVPHLDPEQIILSLMPLIMARPYSDELLISRGWHYRLMLFGSPVRAFEPSQVLALLASQTREVEANLLGELEFCARAVATHAIPHYLLLASKDFRGRAYKFLDMHKPPLYFRDTVPTLKVETACVESSVASTADGLTQTEQSGESGDESAVFAATSTPTDHPIGHLPFERLYRNAMVKTGGYFLENCVELLVESTDKIVCARIILQHLSNEILSQALNLEVVEEAGKAVTEVDDSEGLWWLRSGLLEHVGSLHQDPDSGRRAYQIQELMSRLTERFFVTSSITNGYISPFEEAVNSCNTHQRVCNASATSADHNGGHQPSYLQIVKRTMLEHTGCTLGRIDLCYLRLLENYETIYGKGSCFATVLLLCKKRRFEQGVLNVDNHVHYLILCPYLAGGLAGGYTKPELVYVLGDPVADPKCSRLNTPASSTIANDVYPTLLPVHVAKLLPAWLAGRALQDPPRKSSSTSLIGWKLLGLELNIAASQTGQSGYGTGDTTYAVETVGGDSKFGSCVIGCPEAALVKFSISRSARQVAPHLDFLLLAILILLYAECGNPRAIHLIGRLSERMRLVENFAAQVAQKTGDPLDIVLNRLKQNRCGRIPFAVPDARSIAVATTHAECKLAFLGWILERALISKFVLLGDIVFRSTELATQELHEKVLLIFLSGEDLIRCKRVLRRCPSLRKKYEAELEQLKLKYQHVKNGRQAKAAPGSAALGCGGGATAAGGSALVPSVALSYNKDERLKESLAIVKRLAIMDDVDGAIDFFYKLRNSEGGLLDISVGNKILHLCVINGKLRRAEEILETLRNDAHCEINAIDFIPGSCVRPDVVTCNIIIKGMARERGGHTRLQEIKDFILHMEKPFHLGGDGVKPDQVTFHAVINAAVNANDLQMTWDLFNMMLERSIKIDSFTCNLVARQLSKGVAALNRAAPKSAAAAEGSDDGAAPPALAAMVSRFCAFVEQNDITNYDDNVSLLSSVIDMYSKKETARLKKFLDNVSAKILSRENKGEHRGVDAQELAVLMVGYGKCGKVNKVNSLWRQLESGTRDVKWTTPILGSCIEAFASVKDLNMVLQLAEKTRKLTQSSPSFRPLTASQYSAIIRTCVAHQKQAEALACYNLMKVHELYPNEMAYNALIHSCVQAGDLTTALSILNEMGRAVNPLTSQESKNGSSPHNAAPPPAAATAVRPDIVTYSTIIKGLCDDGDMEAANELFESLPAKGLVRDSVTYNTILEGFARVGDTEAVERVFGEMMTSLNNQAGPVPAPARPTCYTLTILVKFYGRKRQVDHVINLVEVLPSLGRFKLDSYVYTAAIAACAWNNRIEEAYNYLLQMRQQFGCGSRTYGTLVSGCIKNCNCSILMLVMQLIKVDRVRLDKREITALRELLKQFNAHTLNPLWVQSGFNFGIAEELRQVVNQQRQELSIKAS